MATRSSLTGHSDYLDDQGNVRDQYMNVYFIKFNDAGRATEFIEYWIQNRDSRRRARKRQSNRRARKRAATAAA